MYTAWSETSQRHDWDEQRLSVVYYVWVIIIRDSVSDPIWEIEGWVVSAKSVAAEYYNPKYTTSTALRN